VEGNGSGGFRATRGVGWIETRGGTASLGARSHGGGGTLFQQRGEEEDE
jgi:hypothetical protein